MNLRNPPLNAFRPIAAGMLAIALLGCGNQGPERFELTGSVRFCDQPVPMGSIEFVPDAKKGNSGPGTSATIRDGKFATPPGQGTIGGPHIVRIYGFDGKQPRSSGRSQSSGNGPPLEISAGAPLFTTYETTVELPNQATSYDFDVPRDQ